MALYLKVNGVDLENIPESFALAYTEQATRGVTFTRYDGETVTRVTPLTTAQRVKTGRLNVATGDDVGQLTSASMVTLKAAIEAASDASPVHVETNLTLEALDGYFVLEPGTSVGSTPVVTDGTYHAWSATLLRIS